jgi:hypothetical protein
MILTRSRLGRLSPILLYVKLKSIFPVETKGLMRPSLKHMSCC